MVPLFGGAEDPDDPKQEEQMEELIRGMDKTHGHGHQVPTLARGVSS
jgi:hypothetical protein